MKVKYLKPHNGKSQGDTEEVDDDLGNYLVAMNVVKEVKTKEKAS